MLWNSFYNSGATNIQDVPLLAPKAGVGIPQNFGMTVRQSRLWLRYHGGAIAGAKLGGKAAFPNGINMDLVRLRLAYGRLDWNNFSLVFGQDWSVFAPVNPASLSGFAIPNFAGSGNPWIRAPQIRAELRRNLGDNQSLQWQIAVTDPNVGDYSSVFKTTRTPGIGERGRMPAIQTRLAYSAKLAGSDEEVARLRPEARLLDSLAGVSCNTGDEDDTGHGYRLSRAQPAVELMNGLSLGLYR